MPRVRPTSLVGGEVRGRLRGQLGGQVCDYEIILSVSDFRLLKRRRGNDPEQMERTE